MRTGENARELGLYISSCCGQEVLFDKGDCFRRCPKCERLSEWELQEPVISWEDMEELVEQVA